MTAIHWGVLTRSCSNLSRKKDSEKGFPRRSRTQQPNTSVNVTLRNVERLLGSAFPDDWDVQYR
ncbi:MAG TPA: hypothetical protein PLU10_08745, partial [Chitinophagaceae bacterium]|nr:hypothetical protein [Chitinophagaceae bacterium]